MKERDENSIAPDSRPSGDQPKWRQDFPIDVDRDEYVARRDFVKFMTLVSGAFVVGQFWIGVKNTIRRGQGKPPIMAVAAVRDIPVGGFLPFRYPHDHDPCVLLHPDEETFVAFNQKCTHLACAVIPQPEHNRLLCPCHEGAFDLKSGQPTAGPPRRPLPRIVLEIKDGVIYAIDVELRT